MHALGAADLLIGRAIERSLEAHHRYRLRRLGRLEALDPPGDGSPWCREAPPPREGCAIDRAARAAGRAAAPDVDVRVLLWAGAPLRVFTPARRDVRADARELTRDTSAATAGTRRRIRHADVSAGTTRERGSAARSVTRARALCGADLG